jgi:CheY-like chemotaxis protein/HPt (histidine-containing phosphotransfer) domain-containing protein
VLDTVLERGPNAPLVTRYDAIDGGSRGEPGETEQFWSNAAVLVVDDSEVNREVATQMLRGFGCTVTEAEDGLDAVHLFEKGRRFDLVLMDCQMEHLDGYDATRRIRQVESGGARVPVLAVTAMAMPEDEARCLAAGMDDYLLKPFNPDKLISYLKRWLPKDRCGWRKQPPEDAQVPQDAEKASAAREDAPPVLDVERALWVTGGNKPLFHRAAQIYMRNMPKRCDLLAEAVARADFEDVRRLAHSIKGASASVGGERLRSVAGALEVAARSGIVEEISTLATQIRPAYDELEAALFAQISSADAQEKGKA